MALVSAFVTHRHPDFWAQPETYEPERFLPKNAAAIDPFAYFPFLLGRRVCLGEHFAMVEGIVALAMIMQRFMLTRTENAPIRRHPVNTLRLARPLIMRVAAR
jgi:cytochrome P450